MIKSIFYTASSLISLYSLLCFIRIILSWMPSLEYSAVGRILSNICDPFLNWFKRFPFTRIGMLDFSPILAFAVLSLGLNVFTSLAATGKFSLGIVLASLIKILWSYVSFLFNVFIIFLVIRLIYDLFSRYSYSPFWTMIDRFLNPIISWTTRTFARNRALSYRFSIILTLVFLIALRLFSEIIILKLISLILNLPF